MKNRLLPFGLFMLFLGFSSLLFPDDVLAAFPDNNTPDQASDIRMQQIRSNQVTGQISPADVLKARYQLSLLRQKSIPSLGLSWIHAGPTNFSGRSRVVLFDNQDPEGLTIYTGGVTGGVFKSTNKGLTWHALNLGSTEILRVSSMTQTPNGTLYVGTGEYYCGSGRFMGTGLYRSIDGMNFTLVNGTQPVQNDPLSNWAYVIKLACDPTSGRIFAATNAGLKYSDNGDTWTELMAGMATEVTVASNGTVLFVVDYHVYIAVGGNLGNITELSTGEATMLPVTDAGWTSLAIAPSNPNVMYASIAKGSDSFLLGVYMSQDNGATWSIIFPPNPTYEPFGGNGCFSNTIEVFPNDENMVLLGGTFAWLGKKYQPTGYYDWQIVGNYGVGGIISGSGNFAGVSHHDYAFRPNHPMEFAVATSNGISLGTYSDVEFQFQTSTRNLTTAQFNSVTLGPFGNMMMGGANRLGTELFNVIEMNSPTDGFWVPSSPFWTGTFCEWSQMQPATIMFSGTGFGALEPYIRSEDLGLTPALSFLGSISSTLTQYLPSTLWESIDFQYSKDTLWIYARHGTIEADSLVLVRSMNCYECGFYYMVPVTIPEGDSLPVLDPFHSRFFIYGTAGGRSGIYMTQDAIKFYKVPTFFQIAETATDIPTSMSLSSDLNYLWAGTTAGKIYRLSNLTLALDSLSAYVLSPYCIVATSIFEYPEMAGRYITNVVVDPNNSNNVMVTLGNYGNEDYVFVTENALDSLPTFTSAQGNLPGMPVYDGLFEMHGWGRAVLGTDLGIFTTPDIFAASPEWTPDLDGMGDLPVTDLKQQTMVHMFQENVGYIAAASYGRGLFYDTTYYTPVGIDPNPGPGTTTMATLQIRPNPTNQSAYVTYTLTESALTSAHVYDLSGRLMTTVALGSQVRGTHTALLDLGSLPAGTYIVRIGQAFGKVVKTN